MALGLAAPGLAQIGEGETTGPALNSPTNIPHGEAGSGYWAARLGFYDKDDPGEGNPFVDESVTVIEPVLIYDFQATEDFGYHIQLSYDHVSSASIERLSKIQPFTAPYTDAQSGASGDNYVGLDASFRHKLAPDLNANWHAGFSFEYDYFSVGLGGGLSKTLEPADAVVSANLNAYFDQLKLIRWSGVDEGTDNRTSIAATLSWYQVVNPSTHGELGLTVSAQSGFLESPINSVVQTDPSYAANPNLVGNVQGVEFDEQLPDNRLRTALYGTVRHALNDVSAIELGARIYNDDWGISAFDVTPKYIRQFDNGMLWDVRMRYYDQSAADAYQASYTGTGPLPDERTQDSELAKFDSTLFGTHLRWGKQATWDFGVDFLSRSDGLDHLFFSIGWKEGF
ncbi:MAG: DUF3570 domain-containing protein [Planctomycetota bacterium]